MLHRFRRITSDTWFAMGLEFFAIVVGVLFALHVDEWREQRQIAEMNDIAVDRLNEEILRNYEEIGRSVRVVEERFGRLAALAVGTDAPFVERIAEFSGYNFPDLKNSVWARMEHDTLANRIDPVYIDGATELYNQNHRLELLTQAIARLTVSETFHDPVRAPLAWNVSKTLLLQQIQLEREALARYEDFVRRHIPHRLGEQQEP
jgi:hypothetical protein